MPKDMSTLLGMQVADFLEDKGIPLPDQSPEYQLEIAYRMGYADGVRNYAIWKNGTQYVGAMQRPLKDVLAEFQNEKVPVRY